MATTASRTQPTSDPSQLKAHHQSNNAGQSHEKPQPQSVNHKIETEDILGPIPKDWERATDESGRVYFVNHKKKSTSWIDPRTFHLRKHNVKDIVPGELPYGWEEVYDAQSNQYYYVDHLLEEHHWSPPWEKETQEHVLNKQKIAHEKAKLDKSAAKKAVKDQEAIAEVDKHIKELENQRKVLNEVLAVPADGEKKTSRKTTLSKEEIEETVRQLRARNEVLEAEHKKLLDDQKAKSDEVSEIRHLIESERAQRLALETYILQVKQEMVENAASKTGAPAPEPEALPEDDSIEPPQPESDLGALRKRLEIEREERENLKDLTENLLKERAKDDGVPAWVKELDLKTRNNRLKLKIQDVEHPERLDFKDKRDRFGKEGTVKVPGSVAKPEITKPRETGFGKVALESGVDVAKEFD
ncbi:UNVERIFIED_CONTAM: Membrane-associated guanylate kinase, WW and PDZ domain-containing protein 2 [Siphonaria sp. JEL0065]|nr:Membrane-associated guanylate kinase, WW and PDZ domain-containing protein 2 [Siphonaria sp. JEL0065]